MNPKYHLPLLVALSSVLFLVNLGGYDLWPPDEPRFAQVAREMLQSGDFLAPRINGLPYTEKPPMLFWLTALCSLPAGDVTEFTARLPLALAGIVTVIMTYLLARDLFGPRIALWAGLILTTTHRVWWQAHFGQIDMLLTAFTTLSLWCFWQWHRHRGHLALAGFYLAIAAALLTKGPPGLVFPLLMAVVFYWKRSPDRRALHLLPGLGFAVLLACAWLIPARMAISVENGVDTGDGIAANLFRQTIGRFFLGISHAQWPWFYLTHLPADLLPWTLFLPWTLYWVWRRRHESDEIRLLLAWIVPAFVFFSVCIGKRSVYLLPLYPAFAIIFAGSVVGLMDSTHTVWRRRIGVVWGLTLGILALAPLAVLVSPYRTYWQPEFAAVCAILAVCSIHALWANRDREGQRLPAVIVAHTAVIVLLCTIVVFPAMDPYKSARSFCAPLRHLAEAERPYSLYSVGFSREEYIYYARHFHTPVLCDLLPVPEMADLPRYQQAQRQSKMQRGIQKAVLPVPVASMAAVTDAELAALRAAVDAHLEAAVAEESGIPSYERAAAKRLDQLFACVHSEDPAFIMVQEDDWRWILALAPDARQFHVLKDTNVGSRQVLLLANSAGREAALGALPLDRG